MAYAGRIGLVPLVFASLLILPEPQLDAGVDLIFDDGFENHQPVIISSPVLTAEVGVPYSYDVDAEDIDGDALVYSLGSSPAGMNIDAMSGAIAWMPLATGVVDVAVEVADGLGGQAQQAWSITVTEGVDTDSDGLGDFSEEAIGTDPNDPDSDDDGLTDGAEVKVHHTDPLYADTDRDGLGDGEEVNVQGTDPIAVDTDGDYFGDRLELDFGTDPLDPTNHPPGPPDPQSLAPEHDATVSTPLFDSVGFLYDGTPSVQTGVAPGAIDPLQVAVLRGRVLDRLGEPLPGIALAIKDHPELGQTQSRVDGHFDLVVNGGGLLTINFTGTGHLPVQRTVDVPWQDYLSVDDVVMVPLDAQTTAIDLAAGTTQMAAGTPALDDDGTRQAALLFPAGTTAALRLEAGGTQPVDNLTIRATEYTVGERGPDAMPGLLPPTSGYTYAVEFSADEAFAEGVAGLGFSQPVYSYTENFLGFPVGSPVPAGYYDADRAAWVASANGLVIKILGETGGLADVDVDGDDVADTGVALDDLGFTDAERLSLAGSYPAGQELWRVPIEHFTPWDFNWPYGPPLDALPPLQVSPWVEDLDLEGSCPATSSMEDTLEMSLIDGSIIECQNQVLRKEIPIVGTPFSLTYRSADVPDRHIGRTLRIPLTGPAAPASLKRVELRLTIAGQSHHQVFAATPNQSTTFTWDGRDGYGRPVVGRHTVRGAVGYVYDTVYYEPGEAQAAFAQFGATPAEPIAGRDEVILFQPFSEVLGGFDARSLGLGGWRLNVHHLYDPPGKVLNSGAGYTTGAAAVPQGIIHTVAGLPGDESSGYNGDGQPATQALLDGAQDVLALPDGGFLIADTVNHRVRRVGRDGIITTIAGTGASSNSGDGALAVNAGVRAPLSLARGPDGSIFVAAYSQVRKITPDGIITTVAGNGSTSFSGDGGAAVDAGLGSLSGIDVAADGSLYIVAHNTGRVRRVGADGIINTVAGKSGFSQWVEDIPATNAYLVSPRSVRATPDGGFLIGLERTEGGGGRIAYVGVDGIIKTAAINTPYFDPKIPPDSDAGTVDSIYEPFDLDYGPDGIYFADEINSQIGRILPNTEFRLVAGEYRARTTYGDGGPPGAAGLYGPRGVSVDAAGGVYIADPGASQIRRITPAMPGFSSGQIGVASSDGSVYFQFDQRGRHLRTYNSLTGEVLLEFGYDNAGRLASVTDAYGKTTTVTRDPAGNPTAVVGPFGQVTSFAVDVNGFLRQITNPAGEKVEIDNSPGGLIEQWTDARGKVSVYSYSATGLLTEVADNAGYSQTFTRTAATYGFSVERSTALGRTTNYEVYTTQGQGNSHSNTLPDGSMVEAQLNKMTGFDTSVSETGVVTATITTGNPRFGAQAPEYSRVEVMTPGGGPQKIVTISRTATLSNPGDPLSVQSLTGSSTVDGRTSTSSYAAATRTLTLTTPEGRVSTVEFDSLGRIVGSQTGDLAPASATYSALGQLETYAIGTGPGAREGGFTYDDDGFWTTFTDPLGRLLSVERDAAGRVTNKTLPGGVEIGFRYDAAGDLVGITPPGRPEHTFSYTLHGQLASITPPAVPGGGPTELAYNDDRQLLSISRPGGEAVIFNYDFAGRTAGVELQQGGATDAVYSATYTVADQVQSVTGPGAQTVAYDYFGDLIKEITWSGPVVGSVAWEYDNAFRVISETVSGGAPVPYGYDDDDRLLSAGPLSITRSAANGLKQSAALGLVADAWGHNSFGELAAHTVTANAVEVYSVSYTRDLLGRITQKVETVEGVTDTWDYGYDVHGNLAEVQKNSVVVESYTYDANGNRTAATVYGTPVAATYDDQDRLVSYGGTTYEYTPAGRLLTMTEPGDLATGYDYDAVGNLRGVVLPDSTVVSYGLDGPDRRIQRSVDGTVTHRWLYKGILPVAEVDVLGNVVSRFVYIGGNAPAFMVRAGTTYRFVLDQVGSVRLVIDTGNGTVVQRIDYDSFGNVLNDSNPGFQPFGFAGGIYDPETGLTRFGARDYEARTSRWTAKDPSGFAGQDANLYRYAFADPVNYSDPSGFMPGGWWDEITDAFQAINPETGEAMETKAEWELRKAADDKLVQDAKLKTREYARAGMGRRQLACMFNNTVSAGREAFRRTREFVRGGLGAFGFVLKAIDIGELIIESIRSDQPATLMQLCNAINPLPTCGVLEYEMYVDSQPPSA